MGTPVPPPVTPPPISPGDPCTTCWGSGKPFGDGGTPESLIINFSGLVNGPGWVPLMGLPPDGEIIIPQVFGVPCRYQIVIGLQIFIIVFRATDTRIRIDSGLFGLLWMSLVQSPCQLLLPYTNATGFVDGSGLIIVPEIS